MIEYFAFWNTIINRNNTNIDTTTIEFSKHIIIGYGILYTRNMVYNGKFICIQWLVHKIGTNASNLAIFVSLERKKSYLSINGKKKAVQQIDAKLDENWNCVHLEASPSK